jgi:hypothetical protein
MVPERINHFRMSQMALSKHQLRRQETQKAIRAGLFFGRLSLGVGIVSSAVGLAVLTYAFMWGHGWPQAILFVVAAIATLGGALCRYYLEQKGRSLTPDSLWNRTFSSFESA